MSSLSDIDHIKKLMGVTEKAAKKISQLDRNVKKMAGNINIATQKVAILTKKFGGFNRQIIVSNTQVTRFHINIMKLANIFVFFGERVDHTEKKVSAFHVTLKKVPGSAIHAQLAIEALSCRLVTLQSLLESSSNTIVKLAQNITNVFSHAIQESIKSCDLVADSIRSLNSEIHTISDTISQKVLELLPSLTKQIEQWTETNKALIAVGVSEWLKDIVTNLPDLDQYITDLMAKLDELPQKIDQFLKSMIGWGTIFKVILFSFNLIKTLRICRWVVSIIRCLMGLRDRSTSIFKTIGKIFVSTFKMLGKAFLNFGHFLLTTPIGLAVTLLLGLVVAGIFICKNWDTISLKINDILERVSNWFSEKFSAIKETIISAWESIKAKTIALWNSAIDWIGAKWDTLKTWAKEKFDVIKETVIGVWVSVKETTIALWNSAIDWIGQKWDALKAWAKEKFEAISNTVSEAWDGLLNSTSELWGNITATVNDMWEGIKKYFTDAITDVTSAFDEGFVNGLLEMVKKFHPLNMIKDAINGVIEYFTGINLLSEGETFIQSFADGLLSKWNAIKDTVTKPFKKFMNWLGLGKDDGESNENSAIKAYARGGLVSGPQYALIGEDGPEMVIPLTKPERGRTLLMQAASAMGMPSLSGQPRSHDMMRSFAESSSGASNSYSQVQMPAFNPVINIHGGGQSDDLEMRLKRALEEQQQKFKQFVNELSYQRLRTGVN